MAKQPTFRLEALKYFLKGEAIAWAGDTMYLSLHHSAPFGTNAQTLYEISYPGYARQSISASDWDVSGYKLVNNRQITFPNPSGGSSEEVWWVGLGTAQTGTGQLLYYTNVFEEVYLIAVNEPVIIPAGGLTVRET